jgi:predicted membrane protein
MERELERVPRLTPQLLMGLIIIAIGVLFTLNNFGLVEARQYLRYWPVGLILVGTLKVWQSRCGGSAFAGLVFIVAGVSLLLETFRIVTINFFDLWPLVLVFFGASLIWRGLRGGRAAVGTDGHSTISAFAVLGGVHRGNNSRAFRGGDLTAVMGGCEIDLRQAAIDGEAVIDVFAMWGGIEIKVPPDWAVSNQAIAIMGGVEDKSQATSDARQRLVVRGFVVMGGVEIKT